MTIQSSGVSPSIIKFGLTALAGALFGACVYKKQIQSIAKTILSTTSNPQKPKPPSHLGRIDALNKSKNPKLILYFDINKTLILDDSAKTCRSPEQTAIVALAQSIVDVWDEEHEAMSFEDYVHTVLVPRESFESILELKEERTKKICGFLDWLKENRHPAKDKVTQKYQEIMRKITDAEFHQVNYRVFDSFYMLLEKLRMCQIDFVVVLMTFGHDLKRVTDEIGQHPSGIKFSHFGSFKAKKLHLENKTVIDTNELFRAFLQSKEEHYALQANYDEWHKDGERGRSGKPFIYDSTGKAHEVRNLALIFDDNITLDPEKDIVAPLDISGARVLPRTLLSQLIKVDPVEGLLDPKYYISKTASRLHRNGYTEQAARLMG